jgi:cytoskeletal protein CcmA (bactofilin family)
MRNKTKHILSTIALALMFSAPAIAVNFIRTNIFALGEGEVFNDDLWLSAESIAIKGNARNDLFMAATGGSWNAPKEEEGHILLAGQMENDVWALGNSISLSGSIRDHARLLAKSIIISGSVSNSAILAGNSIQLTKSARMGRDVMVFGENVIVEGDIAGNLTIYAKNATLAGKCAGSVKITAGDIVVLAHTQIAGDLVYTAPAELVLDKDVVVRGRLVREAEDIAKAERKPLVSWPSLFFQSWLFAGALCVGALALFLFPAFLNESVAQVQGSTWKCLAVGFVFVCLVPMSCFFLAISLVGLPLAILAAMIFAILAYLSKIIVALFIGSLIIRSRHTGFKAFPAMGLGLLLLYAAAGSGLAGSIVSFLIVCLGMGGIVLAAFARRPVPAP